MLPSEANRELTGDHRDNCEQHQIDKLLPILDVKTIDRWVKEKGGRRDACRRSEQRRSKSPSHRRDQHSNEIYRADMAEVDEPDRYADRHCRNCNEQERE